MDQKIIDYYTHYIIIGIHDNGVWFNVDQYDDYDRAKSLLDSIIKDELESGDINNPITYRLIKMAPEFV
jgi:hypothetical protein